MLVSERVRRYRITGGAAGLVCVDVLVPPEGRGVILEVAERLRDERCGGADDAAARKRATWAAEHEALYDEVVRRFGACCLWNARPRRTLEGLRAIGGDVHAHAGQERVDVDNPAIVENPPSTRICPCFGPANVNRH